MPRTPSPPILPRALASLLLSSDAREVVVGDLDQEFAETLAAGMSPSAARRLYWRQTLASIAAVWRDRRRPAFRAMATGGPMSLFRGLSLDLRSVIRVLRRSPGYAAIAVVSLAIGIGANATMFSIVRQVLLMPLPVEQPDDLRLVYWTPRHTGPLGINNINSSGYIDPSGVAYRSNVSYTQFVAMRDAVAGHADLAAYNFLRRMTASAEGHPPIVTAGTLVSGNFFNALRPPLALGRPLTQQDDQPGARPVVVISYSLWTQFFDNDPGAIGRTLRVNDVPAEVVGVTAAQYRGLSRAGFVAPGDLTFTLATQPLFSPQWGKGELFSDPKTYWLRLIARTTDRTDEPAQAILQTTLGSMLVDGGIDPAIAAKATVGIFPGVRGLDSLRRSALLPLRILATVAAVVLLIACLNVAGLMLARGVSRQRELTVRRALGAGRSRIIRELLLESVLLSVAGGLAGLLVAMWMAPALQSMLASGLGTSGVTIALDWGLIGGTAAIACTAGVVAGLLPAIRFSRAADTLLKDRSGASTVPRLWIGRAVLALQIAVSLPLVTGAGLFLRTLQNLGNVDLGFDPRGVALFTVDPTMNGKAPERNASIFPRLLERLEAIPGVTAATLLENALISGSESDTTATIDGREATIYTNSVGPHYLETMGVRLVSGRSLLATDAGATRVAVINETAARRFFPDKPPIGGRITVGKNTLEVVGVITDSKYDGLRNEVQPTMLQSYLQRPVGSMTVALRSDLSAANLRPTIEAAIHDVDPALPFASYRSQEEQIDETIGKELVFTRLLTLFGGFALLLACVGLHGVTSYSVARQTSEIGIRLALGAQRSRVVWLVLRQVGLLAVTGLAIGLPIAWFTGPVASSFLFGLDGRDPWTILAAAGVMVLVAAVAGFWPARRAARMEALSAIRAE
jgi:predicted permease